MTQQRTFDVFLSHNSKDKLMVRQLARALEARGMQVWLDEWELVPGRPWQEAISGYPLLIPSFTSGAARIRLWQSATPKTRLANRCRRPGA